MQQATNPGAVFFLKRLESIFGKKFLPNLAEVGEATAIIKKDDGIGFDIKMFFVINILHNSPFLGTLRVGDNLLAINGQPLTDQAKISKILQSLFTTSITAKITIIYFRLKSRVQRPSTFPQFQRQDGYSYETAILYNTKGIFHLGLDVRDVDGKIVVCHVLENTLSEQIFPIGCIILDIDGEKLTSCLSFKERMTKSLDIRNYALVLLEIPATDQIKNMWRNTIGTTTKDVVRVYPLPSDVKQYSLEGIVALKRAEPKSILREETTTTKTKKSTSNGNVKIEEKVKEIDFPSGWNSCLFVKLPPPKTFETECPKNSE